MKVSEKIYTQQEEEQLPENLKKVEFFKVIETPEGRRFDLNIPSVGSFRLNTVELVVAVLILLKILKI